MKLFTIFFSATLLCATFSAAAQSHKATKAEVEYQNKAITTIFNALPKNYKGWDRDLPIGDGDDNKIELDQTITNCKGDECYEGVEIIAVYSGERTQEAAALSKQKDAAQGDQKDALGFKLHNMFSISVRFMTNTTTDLVNYEFCPNGGFQNLPPPPGWDAYSFATLNPCKKDSQRDLGDYSFFSIGPKPKFVNGHNEFPLNPALIGAHKTQNIVLVLEGSKESALEFVKNVDVAKLRSLLN